jgi:hypothetical protein
MLRGSYLTSRAVRLHIPSEKQLVLSEMRIFLRATCMSLRKEYCEMQIEKKERFPRMVRNRGSLRMSGCMPRSTERVASHVKV